MYNLDTNTSLQIFRGHNATSSEFVISSTYSDLNSDGTLSPDVDFDTNTSGTTTKTFIFAPTTSGQIRQVKRIEIQNQDTVADTLTIVENDVTNLSWSVKKQINLPVGNSLHYEDANGWYSSDTNASRSFFFSSVPTTPISGTVTANQGNPPWQEVGNVASGSNDSGNPVKVGAKYNSTKPTFSDGQRADLQAGTRGSLQVTLFGVDSASAVVVGSQIDGQGGQNALFTIAQNALYNGATFDRERTPVVFKTVDFVPITAGVGATVWTPAAGKKFRLMGYSLSSSGAGTFKFFDNSLAGTKIFQGPLLATNGIDEQNNLGNGILSASANNVLKLDCSLNTNSCGTIWGTEE